MTKACQHSLLVDWFPLPVFSCPFTDMQRFWRSSSKHRLSIFVFNYYVERWLLDVFTFQCLQILIPRFNPVSNTKFRYPRPSIAEHFILCCRKPGYFLQWKLISKKHSVPSEKRLVDSVKREKQKTSPSY